MLKRFLLILFIPILLCGCNKTQKEEITFASWGSVTEAGITKKIISDFEKENPNIKINFMHIPQNYFQKIHLLFASNTAPDVIFINNLSLPMYAKFLEPLKNIDKSEFYEPAIDGLSYENTLYAVPRDVSNLVFYVNTDKIDLPKSDWNINILTNKYYKDIFTVSYEPKLYYLTPYLSYFGGKILDKDYSLKINTPESVKAVEFYKNLTNKYRTAPNQSQVGSSTLAQMFIDGKILFYLSGRWMYPKISEKADFNWAVINFPYGKLPQLSDVSGWGISKNSKHKDSALKFVEYISNEKSAEYYFSTGLIVPARIKVSKNLENNTHNEKAFLDVISHSEKTVVSKDYQKLADKLNRELDL